MLDQLSGWKSYIGAIGFALLSAVVEWSQEDSITWESKVVIVLLGLFTSLFGVGIAHKIEKVKQRVARKR